MKFIVSPNTVSFTKSNRPCEGAIEEDLTVLDFRSVKTIEEASKKVWFKDWFESGLNHREEGGVIVCEKKEKSRQWVIEIGSLEELIELQSRYGEILIRDSGPYKEARKEIVILGKNKNL